ncbi:MULTISPECIES: HalOD1 output domain-containing protein [Halorussus]|uniref:HalOD1 output domain-containing protein n=1 Tax=Halorussus TaxID=1070314 RepID=UPI00209F33C5|nr:HalOD1 output domain-containing protein [Halorussus vallis]USZ76191.1 hypothetical protein NGM07_02430 [Halorussus vallis]
MCEESPTDGAIGTENVNLEYHISKGETVVDGVLNAVEKANSNSAQLEDDSTITDSVGDSLPPLFDAVEPVALNNLILTSSGQNLEISFPFAGYEIVVTCPNTIRVHEHPSAASATE